MRMETKEYRSPIKKLVRFFEDSRDKWKEKCQEAKLRVKRLHTKVADLQTSRERWREEARQLRAEVAQLREELEEQKADAATC